DGDVELPVGAEVESAALVTAVRAGRECDERAFTGPCAPAVGPPHDQRMRPVLGRVQGVHEAVSGEAGAEGEPNEAAFAVAASGLGGHGGHLRERLQATVA